MNAIQKYLLLRRRAMMAQNIVDDSIIYKLKNYVCDGTAATAINTGIRLFDSSLYPNGWDLVFDFTVDADNVELGSFIRCRNAANPYNGFAVRRVTRNSNPNYMDFGFNNQHQYSYKPAGSRTVVTISKPATGNIEMTTSDGLRISNGQTSVISTLVIGGELANDTTQEWNLERFGKCTIHSLIITKK